MLSTKNLAKLNQKKYRKKYGLFLIEGTKGVEDALNSSLKIEQLLFTKNWSHQNQNLLNSKQAKTIATQYIDDGQLNAIADSTTPQGVIAVARIPESTFPNRFSESATIAILEDIRDPGNLGTMIRTADWFGVDALLLIGGADPFQPKVVRSTMGSIGHVPIIISESITDEIESLKQMGFSIVATRPELANSASIDTPSSKKKAVIFGNESTGTSSKIDELADASIAIPKYGKAESLNVAVSFGIVINELKKTN